MPTAINPGPRPVARKAQGWSDYDLLTRRPQDERVAMGSAAIITVLLHGALLLTIPWNSVASKRPLPPPPQQIEYAMEPLTPEEQQQMARFMQTNPAAPEATPTVTPNFSDRNQRAAQEQPKPNENSDIPRTEGEIENSPTIITGSPAPSVPSPPPSPAASQAQPSAPPAPPPAPAAAETPPAQPAQPAAAAPPPLPALQGLPGTGEGINLAQKPLESATEKPPEKPAETPAETPATPTAQTTPSPATPQATPPTQPTAQTPPAQPAPNPSASAAPARQSVKVEVQPGVVAINKGNASAMGPAAVNAKFNDFGGYLQRMFEAVGSAWTLACERHTFNTQDFGSYVVVVYSINAKGEVVGMRVVDSTASQAATPLCTTAIQSRAPFGAWSKEMVAQLHEHEEIRITFWYR